MACEFRAEYAMPQSQEDRSFAGVFIGGKATPAAIPWQSLVQLIHEEIPVPRLFPFGPTFVIQRACFEVAVWGERPPGERSQIPDAVVRVRIVMSPTSDEAPEWHAVEVVIDPNGVSGTWNGMRLKPVSGPLQAGRPPPQSVQFWLSAPSISAGQTSRRRISAQVSAFAFSTRRPCFGTYNWSRFNLQSPGVTARADPEFDPRLFLKFIDLLHYTLKTLSASQRPAYPAIKGPNLRNGHGVPDSGHSTDGLREQQSPGRAPSLSYSTVTSSSKPQPR